MMRTFAISFLLLSLFAIGYDSFRVHGAVTIAAPAAGGDSGDVSAQDDGTPIPPKP